MWRYYEETYLLQLRKKHLCQLSFQKAQHKCFCFKLELVNLFDQ